MSDDTARETTAQPSDSPLPEPQAIHDAAPVTHASPPSPPAARVTQVRRTYAERLKEFFLSPRS